MGIAFVEPLVHIETELAGQGNITSPVKLAEDWDTI